MRKRRQTESFISMLPVYILGLLASMLGWSCETDREPPPDVSQFEASLHINRFEQALFELDTVQFAEALQTLEQKYPEFSDLYFGQILPARRGDLDSLQQLAFIYGFVTYPGARAVYQEVQRQYPDLAAEKKSLEQMLRYWQYYFPEAEVPDTLTTFISDFTYGGILFGESQMAAGLDLFLDDYNYAAVDPQDPAFSLYLTRTYNKDHLIGKLTQNLVDDRVGPPKGNRMLDIMINNGKKLYILDKLLPDISDTVKMEVSAPQWEWLQENENNIWTYFLQEELLYNTNWQDIRKLVDYSPNSPGMPDEAPGRTANYIGWRIVDAYMQRQAELSLDELIVQDDAQYILETGRYKPRR